MTAFQTQREPEDVDSPADPAEADQGRPTVVPHRMFIGSGLLMVVCGLVLSLLGSTSGESAFDGLKSAAILLLFGLIASIGGPLRLLGWIGYYLGLAAVLIFGLNFARLGYKWFTPTSWYALAPLIACIMSASCLFSFYKICRARRDYFGAILAITATVAAVWYSGSWNDGRGLIAINPSYILALFLMLVGAAIWRFQTAMGVFFRDNLGEKIELAPIVLIGVFAVVGAIKLTGGVLPQGALAALQKVIWPTDEPAAAPGQSLSTDAITPMQATPSDSDDESRPEPIRPKSPKAP